MPRKRYKRRKGRRRKRRGGIESVQPARFTGLAPMIKMTFKYTQLFTFTNLTTVASNQIMRLNSLFDPDVTGAGTQPYLFDQMVDKYNRYRVTHTRWKIKFSTSSLSIYVCVVPSNGSLQAAVVDSVTFTAATMIPFSVSAIISGPSARGMVIKGSKQLHVLNGCSKVEYMTDDRFAAFTTADPTEVLRLNVCTYNSNASTAVVFCEVEMEFSSILYDPIIAPPSFSAPKLDLIRRVKQMSESEVLFCDKLLSIH